MSKRCQSKVVERSAIIAFSLILLISFSFIASSAYAQENIKIMIPQDPGFYYLDSYIDIPVVIENNTDIVLGGFDFLIQYDTSAMELVDIDFDPIDECNWYIMSHRPELSGVEKIFAGVGSTPLGCDFTNGTYALFYLQFYIKNNPENDCLTFPLRFYWTQCADNILFNTAGDSLFLSDTVFDPLMYQFIQQNDTLPTIHGVPDSCYNLPGGGKYKLVDFYNGIIDIICDEPIDMTGDVNLNGLAFEIADYVMFQSYYIYGLAVFNINIQGQLQATDCNKDSIYPTMRDLIFMYRVIIGDISPYPKLGRDGNKHFLPMALFVQDTVAKEVHLVLPDSLSAIHLIFDGEIVPDYSGPEGIAYNYDGIVTRLLLSPGFSGTDSAVYQGLFFAYTGDGIIDSADVSDWEMRDIASQVGVIGEPICGDANSDGSVNVSDVIYIANYVFIGGNPPFPLETGNLNCDGAVNISDAVWLINYIFMEGNDPCEVDGDGIPDC